MYERHEDIVTPPDEAIVWRYMNLEKLLALLATNSLFLCRLDRLRDPWEGVWPNSVANDLKRSLKPEQIIAFQRASEGLNTSMFVSCWHEAAHESAALWSQYAAGAGLAVKSSIARVRRAISGGPNYHIGRINYLDSYSVQSENLFLTHSCSQKVDNFLNRIISSAIRGLQFAVYRECWVWLSVKEAVGQGTTDPLVEKHKHQRHFESLVGKPVKIASALAPQ